MTPPPLTVAEVARRRRVSADTVYAWIAAGELAAVRQGTGKGRDSYAIEEADLAAFLDRRRTVKPPGPRKRAAPRLPELATVERWV